MARDGAEAIDYLFGEGEHQGRGIADRPTLMLLDLKLPKFDGLEVLRRVRADQCTRRIPIVVLTSSDEQKDIIENYNLGANSYVRKPVDYNAFREAVRSLHLCWGQLNEPSASVTGRQ